MRVSNRPTADSLPHVGAVRLRAAQRGESAVPASATPAETRPGVGRDERLARLHDVLSNERFSVVFQAVVDLRSGAVVGAEALSRFHAEPARPPNEWFDEAWEVGLGVALEVAAIRRALASLALLAPGAYVAVNAAPRTITSREFLAALDGVALDQVVIELTEHARVDDYDAVAAALAPLRAAGARLAVDDAGAGFASFEHILRLRPDIIKLDRGLTRKLDDDPARHALASALVGFAASLDARICAEGIETLGELVALQRLGISHGQGYFLGRPAPLPIAAPPAGFWLHEPPRPRLAQIAASLVPAPLGPSSHRSGAVHSRPSPAVLAPDRLEALRCTGLLDSAPDPRFDRFTRLIARLLGAPVALVTLVDEKRQFFKSAFGLPEPLATVRETPLSHSLCQHVVTTKAPLVVEDAYAHPLVCGSLAVSELGVRSYAGVPLISRDGHALGAFCVAAQAPRAWRAEDIDALCTLADAVVTEIELPAALRRVGDREVLFRAMFDHAAVGVVVSDEGGRILRTNPRLRAMLGYDEDELRGRSLSVVKHPDDLESDLVARAELLAGERDEVRIETRYVRRDGSPLWVRISASVVRDAEGRAEFTVAMIEDIDDARRLRAALERSEALYRTVARSIPGGAISVFDDQLRFVLADGPDLLPALGITESDVVGRRLEEVALPENVAPVTRAWRAALAGRSETMRTARAGRDLLVHTAPVRVEGGTVALGVSLVLDVTGLTRVERELREKSATLEAVLDAMNDAVIVADAGGTITRLNATAARSLGLPAVGAAESGRYEDSNLWASIAGPSARASSPLGRAAAGEQLCGEEVSISLPGHPGTRWFSINASPIRDRSGAVVGAVTVGRDVTHKREADEALRESEARLRLLADAAFEGIGIADGNRLLDVNQALAAMCGYEPHELLGRSPLILVAPDDHARIAENQRSGFAGTYEVTGLRKGGAPFAMELRTRPLVWAGRDLRVTAVRDVTERKRAQRALELHSAVVQNMGEGVCLVRANDRTIVYANRTLESMFGYDPGELLGKPASVMLPSNLTETTKGAEVIRCLEAHGRTRYETRRSRKDGSDLWCQATASVLDHADHGVVWVIVQADITHRKRVEADVARRAAVVDLLRAVAADANEAVTAEVAMRVCLRRICEHMHWQIGHVYAARDGAGGDLRPTGIWYTPEPGRYRAFEEATARDSFTAGRGVVGSVLGSRFPRWVVDLGGDPSFTRAAAARANGLRTGVMFPVLVGKEVAAVVEFFTERAQAPDPEIVDLLANVGTILGRVVERERAHATLERHASDVRALSLTDELTGLANRRGFFELGTERLGSLRRAGSGAAIFFVDVDGMKPVNDQLGHEAGDRLLVDAARVLRETTQGSDLIARLGGDEFAVLTHELADDDLDAFELRLRANIDAFNDSAQRPYRVSMSVGVAFDSPLEPNSIEELLTRADARMYEHKRRHRAARRGRNPSIVARGGPA